MKRSYEQYLATLDREYINMTVFNKKRELKLDFLAIKYNHYCYLLYVITNGNLTTNYLILDLRNVENVIIKRRRNCTFYYHDINGRFQSANKSYVNPYIKVTLKLCPTNRIERKHAKNFLSSLKKHQR